MKTKNEIDWINMNVLMNKTVRKVELTFVLGWKVLMLMQELAEGRINRNLS